MKNLEPEEPKTTDYQLLSEALKVMRDQLVNLSLVLKDYQFRSDAELRDQAMRTSEEVLKKLRQQ